MRKHHSSLLPRPLSALHSSLHIIIPHSSCVLPLCFRHQASRLLAFFCVRKGRRLHFQFLIPCSFKIFFIVSFLNVTALALMTSAYVSLGNLRTCRSTSRSSAGE